MTYATHPEYLGLLASVIATPDDDLPRLILADWLQEHGQGDRAEFVRVQVELARLDPSTYADVNRAITLRQRERGLWPMGRRVQEWFHPSLHDVYMNPPDIPVPTPYGIVRRGFVDSISCPLRALLRHGPAVVRGHPMRDVVATDRGPADRTVVNGQWYWFRNHRNALGDWSDENHIPDELFNLLTGGDDLDTIGLPFSTRDLALAALSAALLAWAKATDPEANPYKDLADDQFESIATARREFMRAGFAPDS